MKHANNLVRLALMSTLSLLSNPAQSQYAKQEPVNQSYTALIGNHGTIHVQIDAKSLIVTTTAAASNRRYSFNWADETITVSAAGETLQLMPSSVDFVETLQLLRDQLAYVTVPQRYTWNVFGTKPLNLGLQGTLEKVKRILAKYQAFSPNCIVYNRTTVQELSLSAGVINSLDPLQNEVNAAWVRGGYELVLVPAPRLEVMNGNPVVLRDAEGLDRLTEMDGPQDNTSYSSLACRPVMN